MPAVKKTHLSRPETILWTNKYRENREVKGHLSAIFPGRFGSVAIRQWQLTPVSAVRIYGVIL